MSAPAPTPSFITPAALLEHWQGHRRLTRRVIDAFPEDQLFTHSIGGMRTFGEMAAELLAIGAPMVRGLVTDEWSGYAAPEVGSKSELLARWDEATAVIDEHFGRIPAQRFLETVTTFGEHTGPTYWQILYAIDNEVHHRAQGYVYLRALGLDPPPFFERG